MTPISAGTRPTRRHTPLVYCAIGAVACVGYLALPRSAVAQTYFTLFSMATALAGVVAARRAGSRTGAALTPLRLLAVGFVLGALGEVTELGLLTLNAAPHSGTSIDVLFLSAYAVQLCGMMSLFRTHTASQHRFGWFDAAAIAVMVLTVTWSTMYDAIFGHRGSSVLDWLTRFGGAILGVALVVTALRLVIGLRGRHLGLNLLLGAFSLQLVTDVVAALWTGYEPGGTIDCLWALAYVLMGAAVLADIDSATPLAAPTRLATREIKHTLVLQATVTVFLAGTVMVQVGSSVPVAGLIGWGCSWLVILAITRFRVLGLLRMVGEASDTENQSRLTAMVARSNDVIGLADPDGRIRYLTPSISRIMGVEAEQWIGKRFDELLTGHLEGLSDLAARCALLRQGEAAQWEGSVRDGERTLRITIVNELDTPEVNGWVLTAHDITDQARLTAELRHQSLHDHLTGLANRALLFDRIENSLHRLSRRPDAAIAVVLIDIDDFKAVNDSLGHTTGDELLRAVAERLTRSIRQGDTVARLGGDEFALLLEDTDEAEAFGLAQRALESLAMPVRVGAGDFAVGASAGVVCHRGLADPVDLLRSADLAMYTSKRDGKSKVSLFHSTMHDSAREHLELRMDLAGALERNEFFLMYQPIVDVESNRVAGVEALVRWRHPVRGLVSPAEFIPIAEQSGHIAALGEWVLRTACAEAATWAGPAAPYISVNVAAPQLRQAHFVELVVDTLTSSGLPAPRLLLEITESMLVDDSTNAQTVLSRLRGLGLRVAIDDFGTGYSSLAYLRSLSVDVVKIDQSFVRDLDTNRDHQALTRTILALAEGLGMRSIAEGVETANELATLATLGCAYVQGYFFSRPLPAADVRDFISRFAAVH